ncbi:MAG: hypothetical protein NZ578_02830 [Candidatus Binatia bacterium]|nr:hypothetical protein [Candidatus Binatia bacterium]
MATEHAAAWAAERYFSPRLGISLATLQQALEKVAGPVSFAPRPGSPQGTQEARLPGGAGVVQAAGEAGNLTVVVVWLPLAAHGRLPGGEVRRSVEAVLRLFTSESEAVLFWLEQVLSRAVTEAAGTPHLEAFLSSGYQFKAMYLPTSTPAMVSLTVTAASE